jgi:hypothetical protein
MLPTRLVTHRRHAGMSAADMSDGGSSQHDMMPTIRTKVSSSVRVIKRVVSVIIVGHNKVITSCRQGCQQVFNIVVRVLNRFSPRVDRVIQRYSSFITKVITWLWKVIRWERKLEKMSLVLYCHQFILPKLPHGEVASLAILSIILLIAYWGWGKLAKLCCRIYSSVWYITLFSIDRAISKR